MKTAALTVCGGILVFLGIIASPENPGKIFAPDLANIASPIEAALSGSNDPATVRPEEEFAKSKVEETFVVDSLSISNFSAEFPAFSKYEKQIQQFYQTNNNQTIWYADGKLNKRASELVTRAKNLKEEGIYHNLPYDEKLSSLEESSIENDQFLTALYFAYAERVWEGNHEASSKSGWNISRKQLNLVQSLERFLKSEKYNPVHAQYEKLKTQLEKYQNLSSAEWSSIAAPKKAIKIGETSPVVSSVRKRLAILGDLHGDNGSAVIDNQLKTAIEEFQRRHGLKEDGVIGKELITELNVSPAKRMEQIALNMERFRWLPLESDMSPERLVVNIPEYMLHIYSGGKVDWSTKVVVGKPAHKTPVISNSLQHIVFSPHWNVPPGILRNEVLPAISRDPGYLSRQNMEITGYRNGLPVVRQRPGLGNALGVVKFLFPNKHNVYLHDSPQKALYDHTHRAYSHGCVRVSEPERLAAYLLRNDSRWPESKIYEAMYSGDEKYVDVKQQQVDVYIMYITSWVDDLGRLNFRKDVYGHDKRLEKFIING